MPITPHNILKHELIGLQCRVLKSRNSRQEGISGTVVDETKNMLVIENGKNLRVAKAGAELIFTLASGRKMKISGSLLVARPENRIKMKLKKW